MERACSDACLRFKETIKFWQNCAIVQHTERSMKVRAGDGSNLGELGQLF